MLKISASTLVGFALLAACSGASSAYQLDDDYIGSDDHGHGDVIGRDDFFDVLGIDATLSGHTLSIDIHTRFAGRAGVYKYLTRNHRGIGYGDLFLSHVWAPDPDHNCGMPYLCDDYNNGTDWGLAFSLDDRWNNNGGLGTLYAVTPDNVLLSDEYMSGGVYRDGQEVALDITNAGIALGSGTWSVDADRQVVSLVFGVGGSSLLTGSLNETIAVHWGMICGNDVIEGELNLAQTAPAAVPLPSSALLLVVGWVGIVTRRREL